jgi:hypothetical protein
VTVEYVDPADVGSTVGSDQGLKRVAVTAIDPQGRSSVVTAIRSSSSTYDHAPASPETYVSWVGVTLQVGPREQARVSAGANPLNCIPTTAGG